MKLTSPSPLSSQIDNPELRWLWLQWLLASLLGFVGSLLFIEVGEKTELGILAGAIGGAIIGLIQATILVRFVPQVWSWILVNVLAWGLMAASSFGVMGWFAPASEVLSVRLTYGTLLGAIGGLWLGIWQWLVLRKYFYRAWQWIAVVVASWSIGLSLGWTVGGILRSTTHLFLGDVIGLMVTWAIVGTITGMGLTATVSFKLKSQFLGDRRRA